MKLTFKKLLIFLIAIFAVFGAVNVDQASAAKKVKKATVVAEVTYWGTSQSGPSNGRGVDLFLNTNDANTFAAKMNISPKATIAWAAAGLMLGPVGGATATVVSTAISVNSQLNANKILKLTKKKKKVHIYMIDGDMTIKTWDGSRKSVKSSLGKSWSKQYGGIRYGAIVKPISTKIKYYK